MKKIFTLCAATLCAISMMATDGALDGKFTINANGDQVLFSQGNLQYQASTDTWRFAENQWDTIGAGNRAISATNEGWIDLFGWATSGWNGGTAVNYQPWASTNDPGDYAQEWNYFGYGPDWLDADNHEQYHNIDSLYANYDWGVYNAISNGGNQAGLWRTLSIDEWDYIINKRPNAKSLRSFGRVETTKTNNGSLFNRGVFGYFLLSDDADTVYLNNLLSINSYRWKGDSTNTIPQQAIEFLNGGRPDHHARLKGAIIFLPFAGYRIINDVSEVNKMGFYWSTTADEYNESSFNVLISNTSVNVNDEYSIKGRCDGLSVRLVQDCPKTTTAISNVQSDNVQSTKVLRNGQLFIIRDGRTYNAQGQEIIVP